MKYIGDLTNRAKGYLGDHVLALNTLARATVPLVIGTRFLAGEAHAAYDTLNLAYNPNEHMITLSGWTNDPSLSHAYKQLLVHFNLSDLSGNVTNANNGTVNIFLEDRPSSSAVRRIPGDIIDSHFKF